MITYIKTMEEAERIVRRNHSLHWEGFDIVFIRPDREGFRKTNGVYFKKKWCVKTLLPLTRDGWAVPSEFIK